MPESPDPARLLALFDETARLFHRLRVLARRVHGQGEASAGRRGVLRSLRDGGPQTVPEMARARPVSRQHIQALVDRLRADGLVALHANPAHRRSHRVALAAKGRRLLEAMEARERRLLAGLGLEVSAGALAEAAKTLRAAREALEAWGRRRSKR